MRSTGYGWLGRVVKGLVVTVKLPFSVSSLLDPEFLHASDLICCWIDKLSSFVMIILSAALTFAFVVPGLFVHAFGRSIV